MLAASLRGRMESLMQAHGFEVGTLRSLVREGLATTDRGARVLQSAHHGHNASNHRCRASGNWPVSHAVVGCAASANRVFEN
jgi:hypothetical protein